MLELAPLTQGDDQRDSQLPDVRRLVEVRSGQPESGTTTKRPQSRRQQ